MAAFIQERIDKLVLFFCNRLMIKIQANAAWTYRCSVGFIIFLLMAQLQASNPVLDPKLRATVAGG